MVSEYITRTIVGIVRGCWRSVQLREDTMNPSTFGTCVKLGVPQYFNICYRALILKNDPVVLHDFDQIDKHVKNPHSRICLLILFHKYILLLLQDICWDTIWDAKTVDEAQARFQTQWEIAHQVGAEKLNAMLEHQCHGEEISGCNPEEPLFVLRETFEVSEPKPCGLANCTDQGVYRCSRCKEVYYCSKLHQRFHWRTGHKSSCKTSAGHAPVKS